MRPLHGDRALQSINPETYQQQLDEKLTRLKAEFNDLPLPQIDIYTSKPLHFRMRAEFRIWHENGKAHYGMNKPGEKPITV